MQHPGQMEKEDAAKDSRIKRLPDVQILYPLSLNP
jgi:hypothetical protein